jgi:hypothetical protein
MNTTRRRRLAIVLSWINLAGLVMAVVAGEMMHAAAHVAVGAGLYMWIKRLDESARDGDDVSEDGDAGRIEGLENEVDDLRRELTEAQERLDFAERMLAQRPPQRT